MKKNWMIEQRWVWLPRDLCSGYTSCWCIHKPDDIMIRRSQPNNVFLQELERTSEGAVPKPRSRNAAVERRLRRVQDRAHTQPVTNMEVVNASRYKWLQLAGKKEIWCLFLKFIFFFDSIFVSLWSRAVSAQSLGPVLSVFWFSFILLSIFLYWKKDATTWSQVKLTRAANSVCVRVCVSVCVFAQE